MAFLNVTFQQNFPGRPGNVDPSVPPSGMEAWQRSVEAALAELRTFVTRSSPYLSQPNLQFNDGPLAGAVAYAALPRC